MNPPTRPPAPRRPARKSGVVVPFRPKWHGRILASLIWSASVICEKTLRTTIRDQSGLIQADNTKPVIFAIWHNRLALGMRLWAWAHKRQPHSRLAALISASRDGGLLAEIFRKYGVLAVRGSSSRRGPQAMIELMRLIRHGYHIAITPDGPRGPRYQVQDGIVSLAQLSGCPIIPVGVLLARRISMDSWDGFQLPLPLSRCDLTFGKAIHISREATEAQREAARLQLQAELLRMNPD